jgi:hypothetical protein
MIKLKYSNGVWGEEEFTNSFSSFREFLNDKFKLPGEYNLVNTDSWRQPAIKFIKDKRYSDLEKNSKEYKEFWDFEKRKCTEGFLVDNFYVSPYYYWYLNYQPIYDKIAKDFIHPEIWDSDYHFYLYIDRAILNNKNSCVVKARQRGYSLKHVSIQMNNVWFKRGSINKMLSYDETYIIANWMTIAEPYRDHLNEYTAWYRNFNPNKTLSWMQKIEVKEGVLDRKTSSKGRKSKYLGFTTKGNPTKAVGGPSDTIYLEESGINPTLGKTYRYGEENTRIGGVKTGTIFISGAVGELKDCEDFQELAFAPEKNGILGVEDNYGGAETPICLFVPEIWNFVYSDPHTGEIIKCYDKDGNSDIKKAKIYFEEWNENQKKNLSAKDYKIWKSQHPLTIQDAFEYRDTNIFPVDLLKRRDIALTGQKNIVVRLERDHKGKITHRFSDDVPISTLNPNPNQINEGAIEIKEFPPLNPQWGMYYAGVDPVYRIDTSTSKSLMSITIYRGMTERDGKLVHGYPVACYIGRHKKIEDTYQVCLKLIEFYNARTAVENNVKDFIEWMIQNGKGKYLMRRSELTVISEMMPNSSIRDEIGVRMEGEFKKRCLEKVVAYVEEPISTSFDLTTGESEEIYGVEKIWDRMLIKEMLRYTPKLNTDRLISFVLALIASQSDANRKLIVNNSTPVKQSVVQKIPSQFTKTRIPQKKFRNHFG